MSPTDGGRRGAQAHAAEKVEMQRRLAELETPMGRGRAGELDVMQCLREAGLHVLDTSNGKWKDEGYLDLLVQPEPFDDEEAEVG